MASSIKIRGYESRDANELFGMMRSEDDWTDYSGSLAAQEKYMAALESCIAYVIYEDDTLCGFIRARDDFGYGIYIYDLLVHKNCRGKSYGRMLIERLCGDYDGTVYVMSDVDEYYKKQGYDKIEGSIIIVRE